MAAVTVLAIAVDVRAQGVAPRLQVAPQRGEPGQPDGNGAVALDENVFMSPDRNTLQKLADARTLVAEGRLGEAVRFLGEILESPEDFFFKPNKDSSLHRSLKSEAQRLIGEMPREGRDLYELQYGARARQMLEEAIASGDAVRLAEVSRRFFHTRAGYQAAFLLGLDHFEHGRPLAGGHCLQRLREARTGRWKRNSNRRCR